MIEVTVRLPGGDEHHLDIIRQEPRTSLRFGADDDVEGVYLARLLGRRARFTHRFGDGWVPCVHRALSALIADAPAPPTEDEPAIRERLLRAADDIMALGTEDET